MPDAKPKRAIHKVAVTPAPSKRPPLAPKKPAEETADALRRRESVPDGFVRLGRRLAGLAVERIENPRQTDRTEDIHQVRVQCKRLRALLRLLKPVSDASAVKRENLRLRDAAQTLSAFRDAYVAGETLKRVFEGAAPPRVRHAGRLLGVRGRPPKQKMDLDSVLQSVAKSLHATVTQFEKLPLAARGWAALEPGLEDSYRRARDEYRTCADHGSGHLGDCFHAWRKRVKDLTYQLEFLDNLGAPELQRWRKDCRRLGTLLGEDHDYLVFAAHVREREKHYADLANFRPVRKRLRRRLKKLRAREFALARGLFADKPRIWIARVAGWWRIWKNPGATTVLTLVIDQPKPA
jgi:CHAD domain-containing protein